MKNLIGRSLLEKIAKEITISYPEFPVSRFVKGGSALEGLELKARVLLVTEKLKECLPSDYEQALEILVEVMKRDRLSGFDLWPFSEFIGQHGLDHFELSLKSMMVLTERFTAEFAVRSYFKKDAAQVLSFFHQHATHENTHIRRWVSEGSRPLLPWGERLPQFVADPSPGIGLLQKLRYDEELYVRKSVANHLNDISKHHPDVVLKTLESWVKECPNEHRAKIDWIKRHALRTLIKKGNKGALKLMGVRNEANVKLGKIILSKKKYKLNDRLEFQFEVQSKAKKSQRLVIDYVINFVKANGKLAPKVYKLKVVELAGLKKVVVIKAHHLKPITTMKYYSGNHQLFLQINGKILAEVDWHFTVR